MILTQIKNIKITLLIFLVKREDVMNSKHSYARSTASERVKKLREEYRFTRKYFYEKHGLPEITLQKIENSDRRLTENSIKKIINIFKKENIVVTREWIMNGTGEKPKYIFQENPVVNFNGVEFTNSDEILTNREIEFFEKNNPNSKVIILEDNDMSPRYRKGDYVGGVELPKQKYLEINNMDCIVLVKDHGDYILRTVHKDADNSFRLSIRNKNSNNNRPVVYNAKLSFIAPVIWIRKPNKFK